MAHDEQSLKTVTFNAVLCAHNLARLHEDTGKDSKGNYYQIALDATKPLKKSRQLLLSPLSPVSLRPHYSQVAHFVALQLLSRF